MNQLDHRPRWVRDLSRFVPLKSQFVLTGNVRDLQIRALGDTVTAAALSDVLASTFAEVGYEEVIRYDPVNGFAVLPKADGSSSDAAALLASIGLTASNGVAPAGLDLLSATLDRFVHREGPPVALIIDFASRLTVRTDALSPAEHQLFTRALILAQTARARPAGAERQPRFNTIVWVLDKEGDAPDWFTIGNPKLRHIPLSTPDRANRRVIVSSLISSLPDSRVASPEELTKAENAMVDGTEGLLLIELSAIIQLAKSEKVAMGDLGEAIRRYKVGVTEDAWRRLERGRVRDGAKFVERRVIGQDHAVVHMMDIVKRAVTGIGTNRRGNRPRGIAFLAGPTGVGKTELAKAITQLLFGDESAYIRFDMSEFSSEHADQRLIGAPPGYVGYDVGGELTNAVREKPFSVVLFDEIEKAHPRILDKFLQILDDGVLTSGRGDRVYFSESLIVFTSNLGIYSTMADGSRVANVTPDQPYEEVRTRVRAEIDAHFKLALNRPEILNRFGENIIVFDFIRSEVADRIFDGMITDILREASQSYGSLTLAPSALETLRGLCTSDLSNGGRGIRNKLEIHLINPLARALFEWESAEPLSSAPISVVRVEQSTITSLVLESVK